MDSEVIRQIEARDRERARATIAGDLIALADVFADTLRYVHASASVDDKAKYLDNLRGGFYKYTAFTDLKKDYQVHGDTVFVHGDVRIEVTVKGTPKVVMSRYLAVWLRQAGVWRLGAWQSTPIPA